MQTGPLTGITAPYGQYGPSPLKPSGEKSEVFGPMLEGMLKDVGSQQVAADKSVLDLASGKISDLHGVTLAVAKADLAFRLFLEIRNRLTEAYQEIMRMQV